MHNIATLLTAFSFAPFVQAFVCFSEYEVSWCLGSDCSNSYTFSASHFHNKLLSFYKTGKRPPVKEALFVVRTPPDFLQQLVDECPALPALSYALLAHMRASIGDAAQSEAFKQQSVSIFNGLKPLQQQIMLNSWPINNALMAQEAELQIGRQSNNTILLVNVPGCGRSEDISPQVFHSLGSPRINFAKFAGECRTDLERALMTIASDPAVEQYDFVFLVTGDEQPGFLSATLQAANNGALELNAYVPLGSLRSFIKPNACLNGTLSSNYVGGSFLVGRNRLNEAKNLIKGFVPNKPTNCDVASVLHLIFGEKLDTPLRPDDTRLPAGLRLKHADEYVRNKWTDVEFGPVVPSRPIELPERGRRY